MTLPNLYSDVTKLLIYIQPYHFNNSGDEFSVTVCNITNSSSNTIVTYNVRRLDSTGSGWGLILYLSVFVIEL
jgi:hypothetical protein